MKIAILGVGNILLKDEGVGVKVIKELEGNYSKVYQILLMNTCIRFGKNCFYSQIFRA